MNKRVSFERRFAYLEKELKKDPESELLKKAYLDLKKQFDVYVMHGT